MASVLVLHGPNLNLLGSREQQYYGKQTLQDVNTALSQLAAQLGLSLTHRQSNIEAELMHCIHTCQQDSTQFIIFNPAAFTHTSIALRDALLAVKIPFIEVHLSNIHQRESFRQHSYFSDIAIGTITGLGAEGYLLGLRFAHSYLTQSHIPAAEAPPWTCAKLEN